MTLINVLLLSFVVTVIPDLYTRTVAELIVMKLSRKRSAAVQDQKKKEKKAKVESGAKEVCEASSRAPEKRSSVEVLFSTDQEKREAVELIGHVFEKSEIESKAILDLAQGLQQDEPAIFIKFRSGAEIRNSLRSTFAGTTAAVNRPCPPGKNGNDALQNLKDWVRNQLPGTNETTQESDPHGLAIGNLTYDEYSKLALTLSFNQAPVNQWGIANVANNRSLGGLIGITGTGIRSAAISVLPSIGFCG